METWGRYRGDWSDLVEEREGRKAGRKISDCQADKDIFSKVDGGFSKTKITGQRTSLGMDCIGNPAQPLARNSLWKWGLGMPVGGFQAAAVLNNCALAFGDL